MLFPNSGRPSRDTCCSRSDLHTVAALSTTDTKATNHLIVIVSFIVLIMDITIIMIAFILATILNLVEWEALHILGSKLSGLASP